MALPLGLIRNKDLVFHILNSILPVLNHWQKPKISPGFEFNLYPHFSGCGSDYSWPTKSILLSKLGSTLTTRHSHATEAHEWNVHGCNKCDFCLTCVMETCFLGFSLFSFPVHDTATPHRQGKQGHKMEGA